jgi:SAM-dependent methyltransferase
MAAAQVTGGEFEDEDVVRCYRHRPPYPDALHTRLTELATGRGRLLDLGCGPGKLARGLAERFDRVDAVDPSAAMLAAGRAMDCGAHPNIRWIEAGAEDAPFDGPYDLAVAGASIHWIRHEEVMPRLARALRSGAPLALVDGDGPSEASWRDAFQAVVVRWVEKSGRTWDDTAHKALVSAHLPWIDIHGEETFTHTVQQPLDHFIEAQHSRATWARSRMGAEADAFDADLRAALEPFAADGAVSFTVAVRLAWGAPRHTRRPDA